mgnify:CR=1 FL=1
MSFVTLSFDYWEVRANELLQVLGLTDLEEQGYYWTRTSLELRS